MFKDNSEQIRNALDEWPGIYQWDRTILREIANTQEGIAEILKKLENKNDNSNND